MGDHILGHAKPVRCPRLIEAQRTIQLPGCQNPTYQNLKGLGFILFSYQDVNRNPVQHSGSQMPNSSKANLGSGARLVVSGLPGVSSTGAQGLSLCNLYTVLTFQV